MRRAALYGLPPDLPLSVLVIEILPTITNIYEHFFGLAQLNIHNAMSDTLRLA